MQIHVEQAESPRGDRGIQEQRQRFSRIAARYALTLPSPHLLQVAIIRGGLEAEPRMARLSAAVGFSGDRMEMQGVSARSRSPMNDPSRTALPGAGDALLIIDVQNDFLPGGSLPVPDGDGVIPPLNRCIAAFRLCGLPIIATRDWHPADHCSFQLQGGRWPPHCMRGTAGADFARGLRLPADARVFDKATEPDREAFSAFAVAGLERELRALGIRRLFIGGLATDYCVHDTALDALRYGFRVVVLLDAIRAIDAAPGDGARAVEEMREAGAEFHCVAELQPC